MFNIKNVAKREIFSFSSEICQILVISQTKKSSLLELDFNILLKQKDYFRLITFSEAFIIALAFKPYFSINCSGVPDSPNVSCVATNS